MWKIFIPHWSQNKTLDKTLAELSDEEIKISETEQDTESELYKFAQWIHKEK